MGKRESKNTYGEDSAVAHEVGHDRVHESSTQQEDSGSDRLFFENIEYLEIEEVAAYLRLAPQTIRNWIAKREFPAVDLGRRNVVLRKSLMKWLEKKEKKPWQ